MNDRNDRIEEWTGITVKGTAISVIVGLLAIGMADAGSHCSEANEPPTSIAQAASILAYDAYESLRLPRLDIG